MLQNDVVPSEHKASIMLTAFTWFHLHSAIVYMQLFTEDEIDILAFSYTHQSLSPITSDMQDIEWGEPELMRVLQTFFSTEISDQPLYLHQLNSVVFVFSICLQLVQCSSCV